jgi:hypothetical protein
VAINFPTGPTVGDTYTYGGYLYRWNGTFWIPELAIFPSTTRMLFQQTSAPTGWSKDTSSHNDKALRVVTGTVGSGGSVAFSTVFGKTATDTYTLLTADMPAHSHSGSSTSTFLSGSGSGGSMSADGTFLPAQSITNTGGGGAHAHGIDIRVNYADVMIASKD